MRLLIAMFMLLVIAGCSRQIFSSAAMSRVDVSFKMVKEHPKEYIGHAVMTGGVVAGVRNTTRGSELEVVELPLDRRQRPDPGKESSGRFLVTTGDFLDPVIYQTGLLVSVVGEVTGVKSLPIDSMNYDYPVIALRELHLWRSEEAVPADSPVFHFGVGVFHQL